VQYQVDGVTSNNPYDNASILRLDRSLLQEVQVISGTFDAEYGQAMSGVVNAVLKDGTPDLQWSGEVYFGGFLYGNDRIIEPAFRPGDIESYQATLSGPLPIPETVFFLSGRAYSQDDYVYGVRTFVPSDSVNLETGVRLPTGDGAEVPLGFQHDLSGLAKLTNRSIPNTKATYQAVVNDIESQRLEEFRSFLYRNNPDALSEQKTFSISHGFDVNYALSPLTYLDVSLRQNFFDYEDFVYADVWDPRYDEAGPPLSDPTTGEVLVGVEFTRFRQKTDDRLLKAALTSLVTAKHQLKIGGELHETEVEFGTPGGHLRKVIQDGREIIDRVTEDSPEFPLVRTYYPWTGAAFVQDQMDWADLTVRAGLRLDYFDAQSTVPSDLANPANAIEGAPESYPVPTTVKVPLSPRLGVAFPIHDEASVHFAYGHFYQFPAIGEIFNNADYGVLTNLQAGVLPPLLGNPDVKPERTVQYEMGYSQAFSADLGGDATIFYKDIRDLLGIELISAYNDARYARLTNVDFGDVFGFTVALDQHRLGPASISVDYTWMRAVGNASEPEETLNRVEGGEDARPRRIPFVWDQRHTFNLTVGLATPGSHSASTVVRAASGQPYSPIIERAFGLDQLQNSARKPSGVLVDVRAEKEVRSFGARLSVFGRVLNLFDSRFFNGFVFESSGSPYYSRIPDPDRVQLGDPIRFYEPRRIEFGLRLGGEGS
ncbi:MAG: TonB-dependent receptor plug domain-containing protein, partial [bacterium]